jgi:prepilin-type N-terminal cleavage/methylation domain-containing protein
MKTAFSMIELVFVIVVLGIISALAVPRFSSIQDDALISAEKQSISVARQGILVLYGKRQVRGRNFQTTLYNFDGDEYNCKVHFSDSFFPKSLSVKETTAGTLTDNNLSFDSIAEQYERRALALVVDSEDLVEWEKLDGSSRNVEKLKGPASRYVNDQQNEISSSNYWEYNNTSGKIVLQ